jgi:hypothetical protein
MLKNKIVEVELKGGIAIRKGSEKPTGQEGYTSVVMHLTNFIESGGEYIVQRGKYKLAERHEEDCIILRKLVRKE